MRSPQPATTLRLTLLGAPRLSGPGGERALPWQKPTALLAYLACQPDWVSRDQLATWLRGDSGEDSARAYLRRLLHRLKTLGLADGVEVEPQRLRWVGGCDLRDAEAALTAQDWPAALELLHAPLLDGTGLLGEATVDEFFAEARERWRQRWRGALCARIDALRAAGAAPAQIASAMQSLAADDALDESNVQFLLDRADSEPARQVALAAYDTLQRRLAYEMALRPLPATQTLAATLRDRVFHANVATIAAGSATFAYLTADSAPFIGRRAELAAIDAQLVAGARLVTLLGPGGVGKTRLARRWLDRPGGEDADAAAERVRAWVDLADVDDERGLLVALLAALGVPGLAAPGAPPAVELVAGWLMRRRCAIVLDNAEGLVADRHAVATLGGLLRHGDVRWVVTSREPLGLTVERCVPVSGLPIDDPADHEADSIALFCAFAERHGRAAAPATLPPDQRADIARIARAVDGLPLALELAAQWTVSMSASEIARAIEHDLDFLRSNDADRKPGHRSLRAVFDSAWRRLDARGQRALAALTLCRGGFDATTARAVAEVDRALLLTLVGKSLLQRVDAQRFRLHAQVAQFSAEHLDPLAHAGAARRHARHFLERLIDSEALQLGRHGGATLRRLTPELDNLRAAWRHAVATADWPLLLQALPRAEVLLSQLRRYDDAADWFGRAADACPATHPLASRARIAQALAVLGRGEIDAGRRLLDTIDVKPLSAAEQADLANAHTIVASLRGDMAAALPASKAALDAALRAGHAGLQAQALLNLAVTHWATGALAESETFAVESLALAEQAGTDLIRARAQRTLSVLRKEQGRWEEALRLLERSLQFFESVGETYDVAYNLRGLSFLMADRGDRVAQLDYARRSLAAYESLGLPVPIAQSEFALGLAQVAAGARDDAAATLRRCLRRALQLDVPVVALRALAELAALTAVQDRALALQALRFVLASPALRATDRPEFTRHLDALAPVDSEIAAADHANTSASLATLAARLLAGA